jgi:tryptophan synthase alpha chain
VTRIEARFALARGENRAALVTYVMAGDPDPEASLAVLNALPKAGADIVELGLPFTDPMADGPAIQAAGLRALKAGQTTAKTLDLVRRFRAGDPDTPLILMGYYNPIYSLRRRALPRRCQGGRRRRADRGRPAARGGRRALPSGARGRPRLHPARDSDHGRAPVADSAPEHGRLRLLRLDHRHHRRRDAGFRQGVGRGLAHQAPYEPAGRGRVRVKTGAHAAAIAQGADGVVVGSALIEALRASLDSEGRATEETVPAVRRLVEDLAAGMRSVDKGQAA